MLKAYTKAFGHNSIQAYGMRGFLKGYASTGSKRFMPDASLDCADIMPSECSFVDATDVLVRRPTGWHSAAASALHRTTSKTDRSHARSGLLQCRVGWQPIRRCIPI